MSTTPPVLVNTIPDTGEVTWPPTWPLPRVGERVRFPDRQTHWVRAVDWYPAGEDADDPEPFVCLTLTTQP